MRHRWDLRKEARNAGGSPRTPVSSPSNPIFSCGANEHLLSCNKEEQSVVCMTSVATAASDTKMVRIVINGETSDTRAAIIAGEAYLPLSLLGKLQGQAVKYDVQGEQVVVGTGSAASGSGVNVKPVLEVTMGDPEFKELIEDMGLTAKKETAVPEKLQFYSCVILNNDNAVSPKIAQRLKTFVENGGGLVMHGETLLRLAGTEAPSTVYDDTNLKSIADWFGCTTCYTIQAHGGGFLPATVTTKANKPFGTDLARNTVLFRYKGDQNYSMLSGPDEFSEIIAVWSSDNEKSAPGYFNVANGTYVAALFHPYGKGRVYWQSVTYDPNYPKLSELFKAGIYRAATGKNLKAK